MSRFHVEIGPCRRCGVGTGDHETATGCIVTLGERLEISRNNFLELEAELFRAQAEIAALREVVEAAHEYIETPCCLQAFDMDRFRARVEYDAARAKLKETT